MAAGDNLSIQTAVILPSPPLMRPNLSKVGFYLHDSDGKPISLGTERSLRYYGGKPDNSPTQNQASFADAVNDLHSRGGGTLTVEPGTYHMGTPIWSPYGNFHLKFDLGASISLEPGASCQGLVVASGARPDSNHIIDNVVLEGVVIDGNSSTMTAGFYDFDGSAILDWVQFGILVIGARNVQISGCQTIETVNTGIQIIRCGGLCVIDHCASWLAGTSVEGPRNGPAINQMLPTATQSYDAFSESQSSGIFHSLAVGAWDIGIGGAFQGGGGYNFSDNWVFADWINRPAQDEPTGEVTQLRPNSGGIYLEANQSPSYAWDHYGQHPTMVCRNHIYGVDPAMNITAFRVTGQEDRYPRVIVAENQLIDCESTAIVVSGRGIDIHDNQILNYGCMRHPQMDSSITPHVPIDEEAYGIHVVPSTGSGGTPLVRDINIHDNHIEASTELWQGAARTTMPRVGIGLTAWGGDTEPRLRISVHDNHIIGPGASCEEATYSSGILLTKDIDGLHLDGNKISGWYHGVRAMGGYTPPVGHLSMRGGEITDSLDCGIHLQGSTDVEIDGVLIRNSGRLAGAPIKSGIWLNDCDRVKLHEVRARDDDAGTQEYGLYLSGADNTDVRVESGDLSGNVTGTIYGTTGLALVRGVKGISPKGPLTAPAVPASGVLLVNPFPYDCAVYITGGTVTAVAIGAIGMLQYLYPGRDFEIPGAGAPDLWTPWTESAGDGALADETTIIHGGAHAAKMTSGASANTNAYILSENSIPLTPGNSYWLTLWTQGDGTYAGRYSVYDHTNSAWIITATSTGVTATAWTQLGVAFAAPAGCLRVRVFCYGPADNDSIAYFDDFSLVDMPRATGQVAGCFIVPAFESITVTHSSAPTWQWFGA